MVEMVGHRAFAGCYPENTLQAFNKAFEAGVKIIETDLQMTKDGIVIVNHDDTTGRMWDENYTIANEDYSTLSKLNHKVNSDEKVMTIHDLFTWLVDHNGCRLMLDIKFDNEKLLLNKTLETMLSIKNDISFWQKRIIWGFWLLEWYEYSVETGIIKGFDVIVITMSLDIAEQFIDYSIKLDNENFKLYGISLLYVSSWTRRFREKLLPIVQKWNVKVFLWTVNKQIDMKYLVGLPIYGIITDDPVKSTAYCRLLTDKISNKDTNIFIEPQLNTREGFRFYSFCFIYQIIDQTLHSDWAHRPIFFGISFARLSFKLLKAIHFM